MGLAKGLKYGLAALAYGAQGVAEAAEAQDERENEATKTAVTVAANRLEKAREQAAKDLEEEREKQNEINSLHGSVYGTDKQTGEKRLLSRAEIGQLIGSVGKDNLIKYAVESDRLVVSGKAKATTTEGTTTDITSLIEQTKEAIPESESGVAKGQNKRITANLESQLKRLGYDTETVQSVGRTAYTGGEFEVSPETTDLSTKQDTSYVVNKEGKFTGQVVYTVTKVDKTASGNPIIKHFDHLGNEVKIPQGSSLVDSVAAVGLFEADPDFPKKSGVLYTFNSDGDSVAVKGEDGKPLFGYLMKDGSVRLQIGGKPAEEVYTAQNVLVGTAEDLGAAQLDLLKQGKTFENLPTWKSWTTTRDEVEKLSGPVENERNIILQRVSLLQQYGHKMYGPEAAFATFVTTAKKTVTGVAGIVEQLAGMDAEEANILISQNEQTLVDAVNDRDSILSKIVDENEKIATARVLDSAAASMQAYAKGKANEEGRMTDNDFKIFKSTIAGNNAKQTLALLEQSFQTNLTLYGTRYRSAGFRLEDIESLSDDRIPKDYKQLARRGFERLTLPATYESEVNSAISNARNEIDKMEKGGVVTSETAVTTDVVFTAPNGAELTLQYNPSSRTYSHPSFAGKNLTLDQVTSKGFRAK